MKKNIQLLLCILASIILALLNSPVFHYAKLGLWQDKGYGSNIFGVITYYTINIVSFLGLISIIIFSVLLITNNVKELINPKSWSFLFLMREFLPV